MRQRKKFEQALTLEERKIGSMKQVRRNDSDQWAMCRVWVAMLIIFSIDQITKYLVCAHLSSPRAIIKPFFYLERTANDGAAWNLFAGKRYLLVTISLCAMGAIFFFRKRLQLIYASRRWALGLLLGGIGGNLVDRLRLGVVIDFIDIHLPFYRWPTFNVADSAICIGVCILLFSRK
jgi:signal peptidase II